MATTESTAKWMKIGKVRPSYKGEWSDSLLYDALDMVRYRGELYFAMQDSPRNYEPDTHPDIWLKIGGKGDTGLKGEQGIQGVSGKDGAPGIQGIVGPQGKQGDRGPEGPAGVKGAIGPQGIAGEKGVQGERGPEGPQGPRGAIGIQGPRGVSPQHKWNGQLLSFENTDGSWGASVDLRGSQGVQGPEGPIGKQGIPGPVGPQGQRGGQGERGPVGTTTVTNDPENKSESIPASAYLTNVARSVADNALTRTVQLDARKAPVVVGKFSRIDQRRFYANEDAGRIGYMISDYGSSLYMPAGGVWTYMCFEINRSGAVSTDVDSFGYGISAGGTLFTSGKTDTRIVAFVQRLR